MRMLRKLRLEAGLSTRELAEAAGVAHSVITRIETGRSPGSMLTLTALGKVLGVPTEHHERLADEVAVPAWPDEAA